MPHHRNPVLDHHKTPAGLPGLYSSLPLDRMFYKWYVYISKAFVQKNKIHFKYKYSFFSWMHASLKYWPCEYPIHSLYYYMYNFNRNIMILIKFRVYYPPTFYWHDCSNFINLELWLKLPSNAVSINLWVCTHFSASRQKQTLIQAIVIFLGHWFDFHYVRNWK